MLFPPIAFNSMLWWDASQRRWQKVKRPVYPFAVGSAETELRQMTLHMLGADLQMG